MWAEQETLVPERRARETAILELRLVAGLRHDAFRRRYGVEPRELFAEAIEKHAAGGRLEVDERGIRLTNAGRMVANRVLADFL